MTWLIVAVSVVFAAVRIAGHKGKVYQALAHIWVGGLFALGIWGDGRVELWCAVALTLVEVLCFVGFKVHDAYAARLD